MPFVIKYSFAICKIECISSLLVFNDFQLSVILKRFEVATLIIDTILEKSCLEKLQDVKAKKRLEELNKIRK